jgi:DdrB-like protein
VTIPQITLSEKCRKGGQKVSEIKRAGRQLDITDLLIAALEDAIILLKESHNGKTTSSINKVICKGEAAIRKAHQAEREKAVMIKPQPQSDFIDGRSDIKVGGIMPEVTQSSSLSENSHIEKLITTLGQRLKTQNEIIQAIANSLEDIESHLRQIAISNNPAPNYQRPLSEYPTFDWTSINATVQGEDGDGATTVEWAGQVFTRRCPSNRFGEAIWYSRCVGKDLDGNNKYVRLIVSLRQTAH